ncbi:MAG: 1-(5-phosphoribosyl)-5-[(5-phosphoribosylamino)methylideneamino]imidazole-4-carboxamide isomerase [Clostridia bacterium]
MIILPAIDIKDGNCVRLLRGDYSTVQIVANDILDTAKSFEHDGARWLHMVDLDGAKEKVPVNMQKVLDVKKNTKLKIEIGGGIRDMNTLEKYIDCGIDRVILGSAALYNPDFVKEAVKKYSKQIAVGIDALDGKVATEGWTETSQTDYIDMAKQMEDIGVKYIIFTDISKDGTLNGPNLDMLDKINRSVSSHIIASGGVSNIKDILDLHNLDLYGAIAGKALYTNNLNLSTAVTASQKISKKLASFNFEDELERYFVKSDLIPAIVQEASTGKILMLAYMNMESMQKTMETGYTWFYSRSRNELWNKGATSGHTQKVVSLTSDCDDDTLLIQVNQIGPACHTGNHSCFFKKLI